jgi:type IV pilus assembly protein PilQ
LGDIPILGHLFKRTSRSNDKTELLVFLTPRVVNDAVVQR